MTKLKGSLKDPSCPAPEAKEFTCACIIVEYLLLGCILDFFLHLLGYLINKFLVIWDELGLQDDIMLHHHTARTEEKKKDGFGCPPRW